MKKVLFLVVVAAALLFTSCKKEFTITVQSNNEEWGIVKGGGTYAKGAEIYIEAIANTGYKFVSWQDGNTDNPRTLTVKTNETYTATFASEGSGGKKEFTITVQSNNEEWGIVKGGGTYAKGAEISIEAIAKNGYKFVSWQDGNIDNPRSIMVKTDETYIANFASEGSGGGEEPRLEVFSVSATQKVFFSPGNLEYSTMGSHAVAGGGTATGTWRFAPNQWEIIGIDNKNISSTYTGWIDLFGWGTSGYNNKYPYMTSIKETDYGNGENDIAGTNYDWGVYNAIYHPKTQTTDAPYTWRTLTTGEWVYLLDTRSTVSGIRYAKATIAGVKGLIIVPDNWSQTIYSLSSTDWSGADFTSNIIGENDWAKMEAAGCVFLPAAGGRSETSVKYVGFYGYYWSATYYGSDYAYYLYILSSTLYPSDGNYRSSGRSVRLVKDVK